LNRLDAQLMQSGEPVTPLSLTPDKTFNYGLGFNPSNYTFFIGNQAFPNADTIDVEHGDEVRISLQNFTGQYHPMHLHGHFFRLHTNVGGFLNPPLRDTVLLPPASMAGIPMSTFDFTADNAGQWVFHCHVIYHGEAGMTRVVTYTNNDFDADGLDDSVDLEPTDAHPVLCIDGLGGGYVPGSMVSFDNQWVQGSTTWFYYGLELPNSLPQGAIGELHLFAPVLLGASASGVNDSANMQAMIPAVPALTGFRGAFQALTYDAALAPSFRLSSFAVMRIN